MWRLYLVTAIFMALVACQASPPADQPPGPSAAGTAAAPDEGIMLVLYREISFEAGVDDIADWQDLAKSMNRWDSHPSGRRLA